MTISNNRIANTSINNEFKLNRRVNKPANKSFEAFRVELSTKALLSEEYNSLTNSFPIFEPDALTYTRQNKIIYK
ncbi:MAG: hypothetical protein MJK08_04930 [Campylobacterales bacterium]|nr:hypothetical protein [Campylobacterales bacterium]NQY54735.1 hypothetical protein [Campylobacteraceae bacterium]